MVLFSLKSWNTSLRNSRSGKQIFTTGDVPSKRIAGAALLRGYGFFVAPSCGLVSAGVAFAGGSLGGGGGCSSELRPI
jgi:hypothetical protein